AIAAAAQRRGARGGEGLVVDIAERGELLDEGGDVRRALPRPAALAQLAAQIIGKPCPRRAVAADIADRRLYEAGRVERRAGFARGWGRHGHVCATAEPDYERGPSAMGGG